MSTDARSTPRLAREGTRNLVALAIAAVVCVIALVGYTLFAPAPFSADTVALTTFVFWTAYSLGFLILTHVTFGRADAHTLKSWLAATNSSSRSLAIPATAAQWAVLALVAVTLVLVIPGLLDSPLANALSFAVVITAWLVTVTAYAVHYARLNTQEESLEFPGEKGDQPVFTDYYYLLLPRRPTRDDLLVLGREHPHHPRSLHRHRPDVRRIRVQHLHHRHADQRPLPHRLAADRIDDGPATETRCGGSLAEEADGRSSEGRSCQVVSAGDCTEDVGL